MHRMTGIQDMRQFEHSYFRDFSTTYKSGNQSCYKKNTYYTCHKYFPPVFYFGIITVSKELQRKFVCHSAAGLADDDLTRHLNMHLFAGQRVLNLFDEQQYRLFCQQSRRLVEIRHRWGKKPVISTPPE